MDVKHEIHKFAQNCRDKSIPHEVLTPDKLKEKQINNALAGFAKGCKREDIICMMDTTLFSSGKEGILFTADALYSDRFTLDRTLKGPARYADIKAVKKDTAKKYHLIFTFQNDTAVSVYAGIYSDYICAVLKKILKMLAEKKAAREAAKAKKAEKEQKAKEDALLRDIRTMLDAPEPKDDTPAEPAPKPEAELSEFDKRLNELIAQAKAEEAKSKPQS